ncbi:F-box protein CPR1-like [Vicia villosa]|uniref:F-box protein CPR1-like n=1 Tax=Vicia villosa TaxID=3911 RepID=UPI00273B8F92|nr:F-box protein CPR1-like [Vicia villosa]
MEKSLIAANEKVSNHIYDDIAFFILSKLPLKSLIRFSCASKPWSLLFQNPYFMNMFRTNFLSKDHSHYNDTSLFLQVIPLWFVNPNSAVTPRLYSLFGDKFENMIEFELDWPDSYDNKYCEFGIQGSDSVNGILCIRDTGFGPGAEPIIEEWGRYVLWNPATGEFQITPISPFAFESPFRAMHPIIDFHGFGYDRISDDCKVIQNVRSFPRANEDGREAWEIYSLKSNSWKKLDVDMPIRYQNTFGVEVYMDGVCHWWTESESETCDEVYLVSFDLSNEVFVKTSIPSNMDDAGIDIGNDTRIVYRFLMVLKGSICWISNYKEEAPTFHISVLGEVGVKESWTKLFTVGPLSCIDYPIGIGKKGDIFFNRSDDELVWFDLNTQSFEELGVKGDHTSKIVLYKESLLPFARISD